RVAVDENGDDGLARRGQAEGRGLVDEGAGAGPRGEDGRRVVGDGGAGRVRLGEVEDRAPRGAGALEGERERVLREVDRGARREHGGVLSNYRGKVAPRRSRIAEAFTAVSRSSSSGSERA